MNDSGEPLFGASDPIQGGAPAEPDTHVVRCVFCHYSFDLFAVKWCEHGDHPHPSKICPDCTRCICLHPSYADGFFWKEAPPSFRRNGFRKLFLLYI